MSSSSLSSPEQCVEFHVSTGVKYTSTSSRQLDTGVCCLSLSMTIKQLRKKQLKEMRQMALKRNCELFNFI